MTRILGTCLAAAFVALAAGPVQAALITSPSDLANSISFSFDDPAGSNLTNPIDLGNGVTFSTTGGPGSIGGAPLGAWSLGSNGFWSGAKTFAGVDGDFDDAGEVASMLFDFGSSPVSGVGGFMNFDPNFTYGDPLSLPLPLYIAAYDTDGNLIEGHELPIATTDGFNDGAFYGIATGSADIALFVISGPYAVVDDLTVAADATEVSEPATPALILACAGALGFLARRRARS